MPLKYSWYLDGHIVLMESAGIITRDDLIEENTIMQGYLDQLKYPLLHIISDQTHVEKMPDLRDLKMSTWVKDPRVGWFVFYGIKNPVFRFFIATGSQLFHLRNRVVNTQEEAVAFLESVDKMIIPRRKPAKKPDDASTPS
jgi:hypothetical protein